MNDNEYLNSEQFLKDYIEQNGVPNKDKYIKDDKKTYSKKQKEDRRGPGPIEIKADRELDLHEMTVDEAIANLEITIEEMNFTSSKVLRLIHGGGFGQYGPVKKYVDRHLNGPLCSKISSTRKEGHNSGATIVFLK